MAFKCPHKKECGGPGYSKLISKGSVSTYFLVNSKIRPQKMKILQTNQFAIETAILNEPEDEIDEASRSDRGNQQKIGDSEHDFCLRGLR
jgi:hypothetical protein